MAGLGVALGAGVNVGGRGLGVNEGIWVVVEDGGMVVAVWGSGVVMTEGIICKKGRNKHQQDTAGMRINIIIL
jgi:accessory colonization factor AcfC